jgi:hypothetical protein
MKTGRSKIQKWCVTETAKFKMMSQTMSRSICDNLDKDCAAPNGTHTDTRTQCKAVPFR